ncbi:PIN domain-containing protein [Nesterenkonia sandarakina]|nr:PIN domain-containing protein [Nesterenkonia sandarakina]
MTGQIVLLDANVLVPQRLSSLLLTLAEHDLFDPRWSEEILEEVERTLVHKLGLDPVKAGRRLNAMRRAFPRATVRGHEELPGDPRCDPKDRHVYSAAQVGFADVLVTFNLSDFPAAPTEADDVAVVDPDAFLLALHDQDPRGVEAAIEHEAARMRQPAQEVSDVLRGVAGTVPMTANILHHHWGQSATTMAAYESTGDEGSPWPSPDGEFDFTNPQHVLFMWWTALGGRLNNPEALGALQRLTWSPKAFGDYVWVDEMLEGFSLASKVYFAVDAPARDIAFMRFIPEVAGDSRTFAAMKIPRAVYVTLVANEDDRWWVWDIGNRIPATRDVRGG